MSRILSFSKNGRFMSTDRLKYPGCPPPPPPQKKEIAIDLMENGDYAFTMMIGDRPAAQAFMKPAEAEHFALAILADLEKRRREASLPKPNDGSKMQIVSDWEKRGRK